MLVLMVAGLGVVLVSGVMGDRKLLTLILTMSLVLVPQISCHGSAVAWALGGSAAEWS